MIDHIRLFPDGLSPEDIGNHDEQDKARQELVKTAKQVLLQSIDLYITDLERNNLVEKNSPITGATISFTPERLAELSMKDDDGNLYCLLNWHKIPTTNRSVIVNDEVAEIADKIIREEMADK